MSEPPIHEPQVHPEYSIEFVVEATGISSEMILHYQEQGLIRARDGNFDDETLHTLRQIDHLESAYRMNLSGMKMILQLMAEVDRLRALMRSRR